VLFEVWGLCSLDVMNEFGPAFETVLASEDELGIRQYWLGNVWFVFAQPVSSSRIADP
jgi:hypothetical protein